MFMAMAAHELSDEDFEKLPSWREVKDWPGKIIAVCDYKARDGLNLVLEDGVYKSKPTPKQKWDEGYRFWWDLSNVRRLPEPIPCRGNVWMWQLPKSLAAKFPQRLTSCNYLRILQNAVERRKNQKLQSRSDQLCNYSDFRVDYFAMKE